MNIEIDVAKSEQSLSIRERIAVRILLLMFCFVAPVKYRYQLDKFIEEFWK